MVSESIGLTTSPVLGSFLYNVGGFNFPFYIIGGSFVLSAIVARGMIPSHVDGEIIVDEDEEDIFEQSVTVRQEMSRNIDENDNYDDELLESPTRASSRLQS